MKMLEENSALLYLLRRLFAVTYEDNWEAINDVRGKYLVVARIHEN